MPFFEQNTMIIDKKELLPLLKQILPENPVIIEAGAFNGNDTIQLSSQWPNGTIHSFEPVPEIFTLLEQTTKDHKNVKRYPMALANHSGTADFYIAEHPKKPGKPCQAGTLAKPKDRLLWSPITYPKTISVSTTTLDSWAAQNGICHIDFAWLDLQGNELSVLQASPSLLNHIDYIFMEVNFIDAYEGQPSYPETISWLQGHNFRVMAQDFTDTKSWFFGNILLKRVS